MTIKSLISSLGRLLAIRRDEWWIAAVSAVVSALLNALTIARYFTPFTQLSDNYRRLFVKTFHISGFDPLTYEAVSAWDTAYNVYRHPLLAFFMYPLYLVNRLLMWLTGANCVQFVVAVVLVVSAVYSALMLYRILHELVGIVRGEALLLVVMYFSFAYVMLAVMVPDHFALSMTVLLTTIYACGRRQQQGRPLSKAETVVMFVVTAGISLNNGIKTFLAALFTSGRRFFGWRYLLLAVALPSALMWGFARWEYRHFVWPKEMARKEAKAKAHPQPLPKGGKTAPQTTYNANSAHTPQPSHSAPGQKPSSKTVTPIMQGEFMRWTDISTSRPLSVRENLFGEAIQLHRDHLLGDVLRTRPTIVGYRSVMNYLVELAIVVLFVLGIVAGWRSRLLWTVLAFFAADMVLHVGMGFGLNEIYIMAPHFIYAIPIAIGFLFRRFTANATLQTAVASIAAFLWIYNGYLITSYLI